MNWACRKMKKIIRSKSPEIGQRMPYSKEASLLISELTLRRLIGILGIILPVALMIVGGSPIQPTISNYYYTAAGNIFVGTMCAVGAFLSCYQGWDIRDFLLSLIAGIAAIL